MNSEFIYEFLSSDKGNVNEQTINYIYTQLQPDVAFKAFFTFLRLRKEWFMEYLREKNNIHTENISTADQKEAMISDINKPLDIIFKNMNILLVNHTDKIYQLIDEWLYNKDIHDIPCLQTMLLAMEYNIKKITKTRQISRKTDTSAFNDFC